MKIKKRRKLYEVFVIIPYKIITVIVLIIIIIRLVEQY